MHACVPPTGDTRTAEDSRVFLLRFFERFPRFKSTPFYVSGEIECPDRPGIEMSSQSTPAAPSAYIVTQRKRYSVRAGLARGVCLRLRTARRRGARYRHGAMAAMANFCCWQLAYVGPRSVTFRCRQLNAQILASAPRISTSIFPLILL
jgi:hypothetical protein